jgi:phenylacetate-CoA ligase
MFAAASRHSGSQHRLCGIADGTVMHGLSLIYILRDLSGVQTVFSRLYGNRGPQPVCNWSPTARLSGIGSEIISGFKQRLGAEVQVVVDLVDNIPEASSRIQVHHQPAA